MLFFSILICLLVLYFLFKKNREKENTVSSIEKEHAHATNASIPLYEETIYTDEKGDYKLVKRTREIPRRTYIKADLIGKYWGLINENKSEKYRDTQFFDFNIYEIELKNAQYNKIPFELESDKDFKRDKLPKLLPTFLAENNSQYNVNLHEPVVANVKFSRKLHQQEGKEVFGTIEGEIAGYVLDFLSETYIEKQYLETKTTTPNQNTAPLDKTTVPTGNFELKNGYKRLEFYNSDYKSTYWGNWAYQKTNTRSAASGCLSLFFGILFFSIFISGIINAFRTSTSTSRSQENSSTTSKKRNTITPTPVQPKKEIKEKDTIISHVLTWQDYDGDTYNGKIWVRNNDYKQAKAYKNSIPFQGYQDDYDEIIYLLKENDKQKLQGLYQMFDKISVGKQYSKLKFAEIIVSFVQHIQYAAVLPLDCNPMSYQDDFLQKYLSSPEAICDSFEKFGINTPVEFMANLNGDCDTRTLLLYTILSHYKYDVTLMSSDYYRHSLLGINLPIDGISYTYQNTKYILWETTSKNNKPGVIPNEISNLNYWKILLKSK